LWEAHDNTGLTYREFSILCAINSVIGNKRSVAIRITEPSIRVRAAGFKSWKVANVEPGESQLLTPDQVRYTLERLHRRKFFARARVGAKTVKYMVGLSDDALRTSLLQSETYRSRFKAERAQKDRELMKAIRSANQAASDLYRPNQRWDDSSLETTWNATSRDIITDINISTLNSSIHKQQLLKYRRV
jgi:hypothetical protein